MAGQGADVGAEQRLAAGQHDHGLVAEIGDFVDDAQGLAGGQFLGAAVASGSGVEIAVGAAHVAAPRQIERD